MSDIPHIIHYCWFGKGEKNKLFYKCLESWKKFLPCWQIIEWDEDNTQISDEIDYVKEAYAAKKYAFVSDYIRIKKLVEFGGVYFDTDYELLKPLEHIFESGKLIVGFESKESLLTAFIAAAPNSAVLKEFLNSYEARRFTNENEYDLTPINVGFSAILCEYGVNLTRDEYQTIANGNIVVFPSEVLCGFDVVNWHEKITAETLAVHHMGNSWATLEMKKKIKRIQFFQKLLGYKNYDRIKAWLSRGK